jgi:neutral ceramidase
MRRPRLAFLGPAALLVAGGAYALASFDWCGEWSAAPPRLVSAAVAHGPLHAGGAEVELAPPYPIVVAGYGPPRTEASGARLPLFARAVVLEVGTVRVGLVSVDALIAPETLVSEVRGRCEDLRLGAVWLIASHTHSGFGAYDPRLLSELAGTGRYRESAETAMALAAAQALHQAARRLGPASLELSETRLPQLISSRDEGEPVDSRLSKAVLHTEAGPVQLWVLAAHPTLVGRRSAALDPDYPGRVDALERAADAGITLVLQGAVGNASAAPDAGQPSRPEDFAQALATAAERLGGTSTPEVRLGYARAEAPLPRPDATRLVPWFFRVPGENFLCASAAKTAEVDALALGPWTLIALPAEATAEAAAQVEAASGATRVLSVSNGYLGYVDTPARVRAGQGEARRQYFGPSLAEVLTRAAALAAQGLGAHP